ncbi:hypothetical protein SE17_25890 [Kouleothrix aurantiaca]|uniref:VOC domain-containing protein n=1 Tax=Kouleothrix aurantiaca TaxID=186479 RepID=A0A0P9D5Z6_9CHLR|nr:hypothetical protein SE17_25890 [Kouleothrix aurantiaca]
MMRAHHIALLTPDLARLEAFYTQALGLSVLLRWDDLGIVFLDAGGVQLELCRLDRAGAPPHALDEGDGLNHLAFGVARVDVSYAELVAHGARAISPPQQYRTLRIAFLADPDGNVIELVEENESSRQ